MTGRDEIAVTIYLPPALYEWLVLRKARGHGALTRQVTRYCEEGRIRAELAEAADQIEPAPGGLERIQERIRQERNE
jgi:hypothetical protein